jgi:putative ABC transport system permease protein
MILRLLENNLRIVGRFKLRTSLMGIGVSLGVAILLSGSLLGKGAEDQLVERVNKMFGPGTVLMFGTTLTLEDLSALKRQLPQVVEIAPRLTAGELEVSQGGISRKASVYGHVENAPFVWNRDAVEGRFINARDLASSARVALIGSNLGAVLFGDDDPIGKDIMIGSSPFSIIGILDDAGIDPHGEDLDENVFVPLTTAMRRIINTDKFGSAKIVVSDGDQVASDADQITAILRDRHNLQPGQRDDFAIYTSEFASKTAQAAFDPIQLYLKIAAAVILVIATVVISTIMLVVVRERISEIGLRKAVGATKRQISLQFFFEVMTIALIAGLLGILLGLGATVTISSMFEIPVEIGAINIAASLMAAVIVGLISGILPTNRAANLDAADALR